MKQIIFCLYIFIWVFQVSADNPCNLRTTENGTICVCNSSYCDTVPTIQNLASGQYQLYTTSKANLGFYSEIGTFSNLTNTTTASVIIANLSSTHQSIVGFGGAFTDSTGINIASLPEAVQEFLFQSYFGDEGIEYSLGRVPIGGTDFSTRGYTYADEEDATLSNFALQPEDIQYKIPNIQRARTIRGNKEFKLFASVWSAPIWMKTNNAYSGAGTLKDEYWSLWAQYFIKFFDAYQQNNISFWGVTTQNEPENGVLGISIPNIGYTSAQMRTWVTQYLGPAIRNSSYSDLKIILHDDNRYLLPVFNWLVLSDDKVLQYADGVGVHWYSDRYAPASLLTYASSDKKDLFLFGSEACAGFLAMKDLEPSVVLGSWDRAELYLESIFEDLQYDLGGFTDWNMALDVSGGPTYIDNEVDSPIIVNGTSGEFYKQPMFYALGHFSKFLVPGSVRIDVDELGISSLAFKRPDGKLAVILWNRLESPITVKVNILGATQIFLIDSHSINTLLYSLQGE